MKIRSGFVSNSSSSSFILRKDDYFPDSYSLAASMIKVREWNNDGELVDKLISKVEAGESYPNISFASCNYDTFIVDEGDYLLCETCNNHAHWNITDYGDNISFASLPEEIRLKYSRDGDMNLTGKYSEEEKDCDEFWFVEHDIIGKLASKYTNGKYNNDTYCSECYTDYVVIDGVAQCPRCRKVDE